MACHADPTYGTAQAPPVADVDRVRFVAIGDVGKGTAGQQAVASAVAATCAARGCDFVVLLGDNLYPRGLEHAGDSRADSVIAEPYRQVGVPLYLVLGNHDYGHSRAVGHAQWQLDWAANTAGIELPAQVWQMRAGPVAFVGLDTNHAMQFGERGQEAYLRQSMADTDAPFKVVFGHHPFRSNGPHGNAGQYEGWRGIPFVSGAPLERLFEGALCETADLYLSGHDHSRQLLERCGVTLIVSGAGASATELVDRGNTPRFASASTGLVWLELGADGGQAVFLDANGVQEAAFDVVR